MANNSEAKQYRIDAEECSENPPGSARQGNWSRGRPYSEYKNAPPSLSHPDWRREHAYHEQYYGYGPPPQLPPWSACRQSRGRRRYPRNDYFQYPYHLRSRFRSSETDRDREELDILIDEQIAIIANLKRKRAQEGEEVKDLKANVTRLETEVAGKDEEIKELKVKVGKYKRELNESKEEYEKLKKRLSENVNKIEVELARVQEENRLGRIELTREKNVNKNGKAQVKNLIMQKKKIWEELQKSSKREAASSSFQSSYTNVLDLNTKQRETIENLVSNMTLQMSNYDYIIEHYNRSYNELYKEFCVLHDTYKEQYELKEATEDSHFTTFINYHRSADLIRVECLSKFNDLENLCKEFARLSDQSQQNDASRFISQIFGN